MITPDCRADLDLAELVNLDLKGGLSRLHAFANALLKQSPLEGTHSQQFPDQTSYDVITAKQSLGWHRSSKLKTRRKLSANYRCVLL
ncbi:hypothetical protein QA645_39650 [Bradyrhizobium sp. CIAT3101]|uniref:hypothetical protein n=1 Tax=Bradyrhizobium sp. CIAT3101 TaxID=439387 RepID=UPI0024B1D101|nr:hypothetical protein [Bradyrhizobium sp. CIAT3101]WFU80519.1 hypothetical protein QA645_39650 [Bradyrhizobium sp. CIAT3101]